MFSRQLDQIADGRRSELVAARAATRAARAAGAPHHPIRRKTGWALVWIGLRIAESAGR